MVESSADSSSTKLANLRGIEMAYIDAGDGPAVLFLHGYPFDKSMWKSQIEFLAAAGFRAIAPDLRGLGETSDKFKLLAPRTVAERKDVVKLVRGMIVRSDPKGAAAAQRGMAARRDYTNDLPQIDAPTLIIVGREDPIRPVADAEFMHQRILDSRLEIIEDAAHLTNLERPEKFNDAML